MTNLLIVSDPPAPARLNGEEAAALLRAFPPRPRASSWPATEGSREVVLDRLERPPFRATTPSAQTSRMVGARLLLGWLESFPGDTWQQRWVASPASATYAGWIDGVVQWALAQGRKPRRDAPSSGMLALISADIVRPSMEWLSSNASRHLRHTVQAARDPEGFARLSAQIPARELATSPASEALKANATIIAAQGGGVDDIVVDDLLALVRIKASQNAQTSAVLRAYTWLSGRGQFPTDAPATLHNLAIRSGQVSPAGLVDRYPLRCRPVRNVLVDYLTERQAALDYTSLKVLVSHLVGAFWADLEHHHPGIDSLRLPTEVADAWKARIAVKTTSRRQRDGTMVKITEPRVSAATVKMSVRAFYLDIAEWALDEPERWGPWAAPCPISEGDCGTKKMEQEQKTRSDRRTRERLPVLPLLVQAAERRLKEAKARLDAIDAAPLGSTVTILGETFILPQTSRRTDGRPGRVWDEHGNRRNPRTEEKQAFFAWATIEILRHTGIRIEELLELSHHSIIRYRLPTNGEIVPLLQIAPSKTEKERLLLINPELADVLSALVSRVRQPGGRIKSIPTYDMHEKTWNPPMPVLYQWEVISEQRSISDGFIRRALNDTLEESGLLDNSGEPLRFQPHDFRRIFITDAILNGLPPHIAQVIAGHDSITTTMGYAAIYPSDVIEAHRAFIARRRQMRPTEEYRAISREEWDEFLDHWERRKLALGECGRAYGTDCAHEHACVRCPVLIVGPDERPRLKEIRDNLSARIAEAEREGWLGDVEGLSVSHSAAEEKIAVLDARHQRQESAVFLGIPSIDQLAARTNETDERTE
ncbi:tyrosine-type recombinase/integrase [Streptomyces xiangluensis]|uniref:Tyrosine-type recombinase/integrase n=1 Tax=Streptomyces xiangluensis TaxID=2665720 RepID=A0ABV8YQ35_9ACTN